MSVNAIRFVAGGLIVVGLAGFMNEVRAAEPAELTGTPDGRLHLLANGASIFDLAPCIADGAWNFHSPTAAQTAPDAPFCFAIKTGKDSVPGEVQVVEKDGKAEAVWTFTPATAISFNGLSVNFENTVAALAGGTWSADSRHGTFPRVFGESGLFGGDVRSLTINYPDGRTLAFSFPQPTHVGVQDNRQWGGQTFGVRLGKGIGSLRANERYVLSMTIAVSDGLRYHRDLPVTLEANDEWVPLKDELDIVPGSALDLSGCGFTDGPCGSKGRVIATPDGHFAFADDPKTPRRFYGVNLCFSASYLSKEHVDQLLDRLVRLGYNAVRIHHYESSLTKPEWKPGFDWDPGRVDQLDYLVAGCAKRGIWLTTDLYVSRPVAGKQIGLSGDRIEADRFKALVPVYEPAYQDWVTFTRKLLDRVNPYTGKRLAEEPALAWISLINEGPIGGTSPEWVAAWNHWLAARYPNRDDMDAALGDLADNEDPATGTVLLPTNLRSGTRRARVCQVFHAETEKAMVERMRHFLRDELKCPALLTDINCAGPGIAPLQAARAAFDYVDEHFYVDHPSFLENPWRLPSHCANANPVREGAPGASGCACVRLYGKPFTISEYNYAGPGRFRGVGGILTGAMAAFQDWDVLWRFAYSHKDMFEPAPIDYFNLGSDPLNQAADRVALLLYLRHDLKSAPNSLAIVLPKQVLSNPPSRLSIAGIDWLAWNTRIGCALADNLSQAPAGSIAVSAKDARDRTALTALLSGKGIASGDETGVIRSETGEIVIDKKQGVLCVDTPCTAGGYAEPGQTIVASKAGVRIGEIKTGATVAISSLDGKPIRTSKRLLVTHLTDLQNTGIHYAESARQTLLAWGGLPHLVRDGSATVRLTLTDPAACTVWALSTGGRRVEKVQTKVESGELVFAVNVRGVEGARMLYEVKR